MRRSDLEKSGLKMVQSSKSLNMGEYVGSDCLGWLYVDRGVLAVNAGSSGYDDAFI